MCGSRSRRSNASRSSGSGGAAGTPAAIGAFDCCPASGSRCSRRHLAGRWSVAERGPAGGALGQRAVLAGPVQLGPGRLRAWWSRIEARSRFAEAGVDRGVPERPVDLDAADELRGRDRGSHLHPHPAGARGGGLGQPQPRALTQGEELGLGGGAGLRRAVQRPGRGGREVLVVQLRAARRRPAVAGDLDRARRRRRAR